jgi:hypothetical protein
MIEARQVVQMVTVLIAILCLVEFAIIVYCKIWPWRTVVMPTVILTEIVIFYGWITIGTPLTGISIGPVANSISAVIRLQSVAIVTSYLSYMLYKKYRDKNIYRE